ncbi:4'-phosphopantetheinyl transferase superfamily protein, partial [candidate division KSB1 bacterium]|nr:4'-phosphopantetheinyl transferase superfamily protein [candidate division KSB1 bacterium]
ECAAYRALDEREKCAAFFNCWTRKEAYIKARGAGLSFPLAQFDVAFAPGEETRLLRVRGDAGETARWSLMALHPANGYAAALAVAGQEARLSCWQWR